MDTGENTPKGSAQLARGMSSPLGQFTQPVKTLVDPITEDAWLRLCHSKEKTSSELLRDVVYLLVHGKTPSEMSSDDTRALLARIGPIQDRIGARA